MADCDSKLKRCIEKLNNLKLENASSNMMKALSRKSDNLSATSENRKTRRIIRRKREKSKTSILVDLEIFLNDKLMNLRQKFNNKNIREKTSERLSATGAKPFQRDNEGRYPLLVAVEKGALKLIQIMFGDNPEIDADDQLIINKALHEAANTNHFEIFKFLVKKGADANSKDESGLSVLDKALEQQNHLLVRFLMIEKYFVDDVFKNFLHYYSKYSTIALVRGDFRALQELAYTYGNFGTNDDMKVACGSFQSVAETSYPIDGAQETGIDSMETTDF